RPRPVRLACRADGIEPGVSRSKVNRSIRANRRRGTHYAASKESPIRRALWRDGIQQPAAIRARAYIPARPNVNRPTRSDARGGVSIETKLNGPQRRRRRFREARRASDRRHQTNQKSNQSPALTVAAPALTRTPWQLDSL